MLRKTIIVPTYNAANTIEETLISIQENNPSLYNISEVFIADDFSIDETIDVSTKSWTDKKTNIRIVKSDLNQGERGNLNRIIKSIKNDYDWILILHADDLAKANWLKEMCYAIDESDETIASISSSYDVFWEDGRIEPGEEKLNSTTITGDKNAIRNTLKSGTWWHISGCAIKLSLFEATGGFNEEMPQFGDMEWILKVFNSGLSITYVPKCLTLYRQLSSSVSSNSFKKHQDIFEHANLVIYYSKLFSSRQLINFYLKFNLQLFKRNIRSVLSGNFLRLRLSIMMTLYLTKIFGFTHTPTISFNENRFDSN
ncbi:MAG: glycosyltransferase family 2 protein [Pedobacter sp.]|nr:MAG: glycosyltransferase family 2 protein [Pedobacter sp.]